MRLRPGVPLAQADDTLSSVARIWENARGGGNSDLFTAYVDAIDATYGQLRQTFQAPDLAAGLRSAVFWNIVANAGANAQLGVFRDPAVAANLLRAQRPVNQAITAEIDARLRALAAARVELDRLKVLAARPGLPIVYDTNTMNHWAAPNAVRWREVLNARNEETRLARLIAAASPRRTRRPDTQRRHSAPEAGQGSDQVSRPGVERHDPG